MKLLKQYYHEFINWIENGDILLPVILIAVVHYATALAKFDYWFVAASIGMLVDISHYRVVKLYYAGKSAFWAIVLTIWSFFMHLFYYWESGAEWWSIPFATTIPLVIFCLGWITKTLRLDEKMSRIVSRESQAARTRIETEIPTETKNETEIPNISQGETRNLKSYKQEKMRQIMERFGVSRSTAYRNYDKYLREMAESDEILSTVQRVKDVT